VANRWQRSVRRGDVQPGRVRGAGQETRRPNVVELGDVATILMIIAMALFVFGFIASTSQFMFVIFAWGLAFISFVVAMFLWGMALIRRYR
jgi:hypothetical protein